MAESQGNQGRSFQGWMISNLAMGAGFSAFVALLIPPYITGITGNAADAGVIMAIISLAAILGPVLGGLADRYRAHRSIMSLGVLGMAVAFFAYSISAEAQAIYALEALLMGVSIAAVSAVGPAFIVGAKLPQALEARRLTTYNLVAPAGQVLGGVLLGAAVAAGMGFDQRFTIAGFVMLGAFLITWFTSKEAADRIVVEASSSEQNGKSSGFKQVLISIFGMYLLVLTLSSIANNGINNQISNILPNVYGFSELQTSTMISLAGLLNLVLFLAAGRWMARSGPMTVFNFGNLMRFLGGLGMAVLGMATNSPALLVVAFVQILYQGIPFVRLTQAALAVRFATVSAGQASGWVIGASATGSFIGSVIGGYLADNVGFNAINWMAAIAAGVAVLLTVLILRPAYGKRVESSA